MKNIFNFRVIVFSNGAQEITVFIHPKSYAVLGISISGGYYRRISDVEDLIKEIEDVFNSKKNHYIGLNDFSINIKAEQSFVKWDLDSSKQTFEIPTKIVLRFYREYLDFLNLYYSGGIPGLIPPENLEQWVKNSKPIFPALFSPVRGDESAED